VVIRFWFEVSYEPVLVDYALNLNN
jgi:hypothetical protein